MGPTTTLIAWMPPFIYGCQALSVFVRPNLGIIVFFAMGFPLLAAINRCWPEPAALRGNGENGKKPR